MISRRKRPKEKEIVDEAQKNSKGGATPALGGAKGGTSLTERHEQEGRS